MLGLTRNLPRYSLSAAEPVSVCFCRNRTSTARPYPSFKVGRTRTQLPWHQRRL